MMAVARGLASCAFRVGFVNTSPANMYSTQMLPQCRASRNAGVDKAFQLPEERIMAPNELLRAALPGIIVGCSLWAIGALVGPKIGPGWTDVIQGSSFFIGLIWAAVGVRRKASEINRSSQQHTP
jgi:hypothetical protein